MKHQVVEMMYPQLQLTKQELQHEFKLRRGTIFDYVTIEADNLLDHYVPAILVLLFNNGKIDSDKSIVQMSAVMQFIHFGTLIHNQIDESDDDSTQFPILVGDYLYGKFFETLCKADRIKFLGPLSNVIKLIHEAEVELHLLNDGEKNKATLLRLYETRWGEFFGLSCLIGSQFNNESPEEQNTAYSAGRMLGVFYGAVKNDSFKLEWCEDIRLKATILTKRLNNSQAKKGLLSLIDYYYDVVQDRSNSKSSLVV
ncbi:MAG: hypothetical protein SCK28_01665 [Bacillota bacterium]|nr:hypothetical protein [Bacillota bacterium]